MKRTFAAIAALLISTACRAGSVLIPNLEADTAVTVTGPAQSNAIAQAAAHLLRTDNPHSVTAAQIGALTEEADTLDSVASRWSVSTHAFTIKPQDDLYPFVTLSQAYVSILASAHNTMAITTNRIFFTEDDETSAWNFRRTPGDYHVAATEDLVTKADASTALVINGIRGSSGTGGVWNIETSSIQTNDVDDRVRLLAPTNSPTFTGALTLTGTLTTSNGVTVSYGYWTNGSPATIKSYLGTNYYESLY